MNEKNCNFKKIEFAIQLVVLVCYLLANLFYYRSFHYISFCLLLIIFLKNGYFLAKRKTIMLPKELCKEWKNMYPLYIIGSAFIVDRILRLIYCFLGKGDGIIRDISLNADICFVWVVIICLFVGEIKQRINEQKVGKEKRYVHLYSSIFQWCILVIAILIAIKTDMFYSSTRTRYYMEDVSMYHIAESKGGFFPDEIPKEAKNVEYYRTPGGILDDFGHQIRLKMTVNQDYITQLLDIYEGIEETKIIQNCSVLNPNNCKDYFYDKDLTENIGEYFGKENCIIYFIYDGDAGFVVDYTTNEVKLFYDWNL